MSQESFLEEESVRSLLTESGAIRRGPKQHARAQVDAVQRSRLITATVATVADVGYAGMTVAHVIERAGVSRRTFYELFKDIEDCFLASYEWGMKQVEELIVEAYREEPTWRDGLRAGMATLLGFFDVEPGWARLLVVEGLCAGPRALARRVQTLERLAAAIDAECDQQTPGARFPLAADVVVGGTVWVIYDHLVAHPQTSLTDLHSGLMAMVMLPYVGPREALREIQAAPE